MPFTKATASLAGRNLLGKNGLVKPPVSPNKKKSHSFRAVAILKQEGLHLVRGVRKTRDKKPEVYVPIDHNDKPRPRKKPGPKPGFKRKPKSKPGRKPGRTKKQSDKKKRVVKRGSIKKDPICAICKIDKDDTKVLLCETCDTGAQHMYCCTPKLKRVPTGKWSCNKCKNKSKRGSKKKEPVKKRMGRPAGRQSKQAVESSDDEDDGLDIEALKEKIKRSLKLKKLKGKVALRRAVKTAVDNAFLKLPVSSSSESSSSSSESDSSSDSESSSSGSSSSSSSSSSSPSDSEDEVVAKKRSRPKNWNTRPGSDKKRRTAPSSMVKINMPMSLAHRHIKLTAFDWVKLAAGDICPKCMERILVPATTNVKRQSNKLTIYLKCTQCEWKGERFAAFA